MNINFKKEETEYLLDILEKDLNETKTEIHHTANHSYKEELKEKMKFIQLLMSKVTLAGPDSLMTETRKDTKPSRKKA